MTDDDDKMTGYRSTKDPYAPLPGFVPEVLNDRSQAIYCLGSVRNEIRPVGYGVTGNRRLVKPVPDNKLPGYYRSVPTGLCAVAAKSG
jgi:hypothetical protein